MDLSIEYLSMINFKSSNHCYLIMNPFEHLLLLIIIVGLIIMLGGFLISTVLGYLKQKQITALYLGLTYVFFIISFVIFIIGHIISIIAGESVGIYYQLSMLADAFVIMGVISIVLFHTGFAEVKRSNKIIELAIGLAVVILILLPFNYLPAENNEFRKFTYIVMSIYGIVTYSHLSYSFLNIAKKSTLRRKELNVMGIGSLIFLLYFVVISVFGITQNVIFILIGMISLYLSFFCYFLGIYLPKLKAK